MPTCLAPGCSHTTGKVKKKFFPFPKPNNEAEKERVKKWFANLKTGLKVESFQFGHNSVLCEDHFHPNCFARDFQAELMNTPLKKKLVTGAIPTIFKHKIYDQINVDGTSAIPRETSRKRQLGKESEEVRNPHLFAFS